MTPETYRRNPARDVEQLASATVKPWVADRGVVSDTSEGHGPDFRIDYHGGGVGLGEVAWHEDRVVQEMWSVTLQQDQPQVVPLPAGLGQWSTRLVRGASIKVLYRDLPHFVEALAATGASHLAIYGVLPRGVIGDEARRLGIDYISRANTEEPSGVLYFMPTSGGMVPTDPNTITDWIDRVIADPLYADTTDKLLKREADERHVFMMSGSLTDFGEEERLRRAADALPTRSPMVPDGITHVWGVARYGAAPVVLWVAGVGWTTVPAPNLDALYDT